MGAESKVEAATLAGAMALAFGEIDAAMKSANNPHFKSKYADITAVIEAVKPALIKHGLFFTQHPEPSERGVTIETFLHHANGDKLSLGKLYVPANKNDAQGFGSALTYARRYALVTAFGVPVEDDDGNAAARTVKRDEPRVTDEQVVKVQSLLQATGIDAVNFCRVMRCKDIPDLPASRFDEAVNRLEKKLAEMAKAATNDKAREPA